MNPERLQGPRPGRRLSTRLLIAQGLVLVASILTAGLVAALVGPGMFHKHLVESGHSPNSPELGHIEEAYRAASAISLGVALLIALTCALIVTWYLTTRLQEPLVALTKAAQQMSGGQYSTRVVVDAGPELGSLADAFNAMAERLETTEETRRRLLSDLAHELRTPIATIGAYLDGLEDGVIAWGDEADSVIRAQSGRLLRLTEDLDEVSRAEEGRLQLVREVCGADHLVATVVRANAAVFAEAGTALVVGPGDPAAEVEVDPDRFAQVLGNLLNNARRHTPAGGTVTVSVRSVGDQVVFAVSDDGDGIPADQLPHVFERFYRGDSARDRERQGSGIGLTISQAIVVAHGGSLTAASAGPGQGARFEVSLPAVER